MKTTIRSKKSQLGANLVEYSLIVAFVAAAVATTVMLIGQRVDDRFDQVCFHFDQEACN